MIKIINFEKKNWFIISSLIYKLILDLSYFYFINPVFEYEGYIIHQNVTKYFESFALYFVFILLIPYRLIKPSSFLVVFLFFSYITPLLVFYSFSNEDRVHLYIVLLGFSMIILMGRAKLLKVKKLYSGNLIVIFTSTVCVSIVTLWMIYSGGFSHFNMDMSKVYEYRRVVGPLLYVGPMSYLIVWVTKVFGPTLLAFALWKKKYFFSIIIFLLHFLWFGLSSHKSVLFYPFLIIILWLLFTRTRALSLVPIGMCIFAIISLIAYFIFDNVFIGSMFIRRVLFVPSYLTFVYYDFFSINKYIYWSNSFMSFFIEYPFESNTALLIGEYLGTDATANNSFLSTGYMHAGVFGIFIYGLIVGILFRLIDSFSSNQIPIWLALSVIIVPAQSLITSSDLPTSLLTHGLAISVLMIYLIRSPKINAE